MNSLLQEISLLVEDFGSAPNFKKIWCIVIKRMGGVLYGFRSNVH